MTFVDNGNGTATLSGTTTAAGTYPLTFTAANGVLPNATQSFTLTVNQATQGPTAPTNLTATGGTDQVSLSWTASTDSLGVTGYLVYRQSPGSDTFLQVGTTTSTTLHRHRPGGQQHLQLRGAGHRRRRQPQPLLQRGHAATSATIPGLVAAYSFNEGTGTTVHRLLRQRQQRHHQQRDLDHRGQVRRRPGLQRHQRTGDHHRLGLAASDDRR